MKVETSILEDNRFGNRFFNDIKQYIADNYSPAELFDIGDLEDWAYANGFVKED